MLEWTGAHAGWTYAAPAWPSLLGLVGLGLLIGLRALLRAAAPPASGARAALGALLALAPLALALLLHAPAPEGALAPLSAALGPALYLMVVGLGLALSLSGGALAELSRPGRMAPVPLVGIALALGLQVPLGAELWALRALPGAPTLALSDPRPLHLGQRRAAQLEVLGAPPGWTAPRLPVEASRAGPLRLRATAAGPHLRVGGEVELQVVADTAPEAEGLLRAGAWTLVDAATGAALVLRARELGVEDGLHQLELWREDPPAPGDLLREPAVVPPLRAHRADGALRLRSGALALETFPDAEAEVLQGLPADSLGCESALLPRLRCACGGPGAAVQGLLRCLEPALIRSTAPGPGGWAPVLLDLRRAP